ncbi:MAG: hypothetical protein Q9187_005639 [Circinaria calcarea]
MSGEHHPIIRMRRFLFLALFISLLLPCQTLNPPSYWTKPPAAGTNALFVENVVFQLNGDATLQWVTDKTFYSIFLFQQRIDISAAALGNPIYSKDEGEEEKGSYTWRVTTQSFLLTDSDVFFFSLAPSGNLDNDATTSHYFNISDRSLTVSTTSSTASFSTSTTSSTSTASSTSTTSSATISSTSTTPAGNVPTVPANPSSSSVKKIGLGVSLGVSVPIILLLAALVVFVFKRGRKKNSLPSQNEYGTPVELLKRDLFPPLNGYGISTEIPDGQGIRSELPDSELKRLRVAELS